MAIQFDINEQNKAPEENSKVEQNVIQNKSKPKKQKDALKIISIVLLSFSIIGILYALLYSFSAIIVFLPAIFLWLIWVMMIIICSAVSIGTIWFSASFVAFNSAFMNFNTNISTSSEAVMEFTYKILPYTAVFFSLTTIAFLIVSIVGFVQNKKQNAQIVSKSIENGENDVQNENAFINSKKQLKNAFKGQLIWAIIITIVFGIAIGFDISAYLSFI